MVNEFASDSLSITGQYAFNTICMHGVNESYLNNYTLFCKLILGVTHFSDKYQKIHKESIVMNHLKF